MAQSHQQTQDLLDLLELRARHFFLQHVHQPETTDQALNPHGENITETGKLVYKLIHQGRKKLGYKAYLI